MNIVSKEPVLTAAVIAGAIVAIASALGVVLRLDLVETVVAALLPVIAALVARSRVTPTPAPAPTPVTPPVIPPTKLPPAA